MKERKPRKPNILREIVKKIIVKEKILWPRDMAVAKRLFTMIPDEQFWLTLKVNRQVESMIWVAGEKSKQDFLTKYKIFKLDDKPQETYNEIQEEKVGEDYKVDKKPPSVWDFIKK